ncbi:MAG: MerR family transcriptional regulator [Deltaproteobacteria bacterium]|nr:MerR family transcriptional regulator [Deltaproteobacteria bacterium]
MPRASKSPRTEQGPYYSIQLVSRSTGVTADTLRMWERRYGFPDPKRDLRGNRLYTEDDIERLQHVKRALQAGFKPSEVVSKPLAEVARLVSRAAHVQKDVGRPSRGSTLIDAVVLGDATAARADIRRAALALGPKVFVVDYVAPLVAEIGRLWAAGKLEVHQEHLASDLLCTQLRAMFSSFEDTGTPVVAMATLSGEHHQLGLWMAALYLVAEGARVWMLGPDMPAEQIVRAMQGLNANVAAVSISPSADLHAVRQDLSRMLALLPPGTELWAGGEASKQLDLRDRRFRATSTWRELDHALSRCRR